MAKTDLLSEWNVRQMLKADAIALAISRGEKIEARDETIDRLRGRITELEGELTEQKSKVKKYIADLWKRVFQAETEVEVYQNIMIAKGMIRREEVVVPDTTELKVEHIPDHVDYEKRNIMPPEKRTPKSIFQDRVDWFNW